MAPWRELLDTIPGVRTQVLGWQHEEMHHYANEVHTLEIL